MRFSAAIFLWLCFNLPCNWRICDSITFDQASICCQHGPHLVLLFDSVPACKEEKRKGKNNFVDLLVQDSTALFI